MLIFKKKLLMRLDTRQGNFMNSVKIGKYM